jgi:hypothetical protein
MIGSMMRKAMFSGDGATLSLDFTTGAIPTAVTFTRSDSTARATYIDVSGYVKTVATAGAARFDYTGGVAKGLLIEAAATNLLSRSEEFNLAGPWFSFNATITANDGTAPDGNTTADSIQASTSGAGGVFRSSEVPSGTHTFSVFAKANGANSFSVSIDTSGNGRGVDFTLTSGGSAGTPYVRGTGGTVSSLTASVQTFQSGWVRCIVTAVTTGTNSVALYTQSGTSKWLAWGAQLEASSNASSYIPTTTASLTRLADDAVIRSTAWTSLYSKPGSIVVEYYRGEYGAGDRSVLAIDTAATKHIHLKHANASAASGIYNSAGTGVATKATGNASGLNKAAFTWSSANPSVIKYALNGNATVVSATSDIGATLGTWMTIGSASTTGVSGTGTWEGYLNNSIKSIKYYSEVLSDADMIAKTT